YLVLEVKGGRITHDQQGWHSEDRHGQVHSIKDPGGQAQGQCRSIDNYLGTLTSYSNRPPFEWAVCFSDTEVNKQAKLLELPSAKILDAADLRSGNIQVWVDSILKRAKSRKDHQHYNSELFIRALAPALDLIPRLRDRMEDEALELVRLTERQKKLMQMVRLNSHIGIRGGAGTGKTMIAVERARRLSESGESVLLLCYSTSLARYISDQLERADVLTFHELCRTMAQRAKLPFEVPADHERQRIFWQSSVQYLLDKALELMPEQRWDHIIIDEGQDFPESWFTSILELKRNEDSSLWVLYDPNQQVYGGTRRDLATELDLTPCVLDENCRNTRNIGRRVGELISDCITIPPDAPEGDNVMLETCPDAEAMTECLRKNLHALIHTERISPTSIVVLSPRLPETSDIWLRKTFGNVTLRLMEEAPSTNTVRFSSLHRFKGLEADVVILCEVSPGSISCTNEHLYVGCSRARHKLIELHYDA
ncbi:MAG: hypothetical protein EA349_03720, partial [Halomonadaceae bacterium]